MADSDSEIEFNRRHNDTEMEEDQPGTHTEELDQQQQHDIHDRAASVLSSIDDIPELEEAPEQEPQSRPTMESEYLGIPIDPQAKGDISGNASCSILHTSPHMKPQTYNGDEDWESYLNHFEICAKLGRWSYQDRVLYLAASLRGNAQVYYMALMPAERSSYHTLVVKLGLRFSNASQQPMWISRLEARVRRQNESIAELGDDLRRMSQRAYSSLNNEAKEMLALNQLYKSVSPEMKYKCISKNCTSVTQAVSIIELYEAILGEDSAKNLVRQATAEPDRNSQAKESFSYSRDDNNLRGILRKLQNWIDMLSRQCNTQTHCDQGPRDRNGQRLCYICFSPRHLQRDCPHREGNRRDQWLFQQPYPQPHQQSMGEYMYCGIQQENYNVSKH